MFKKKNNELEINNDIAILVKEARLKKGLSTRKLAELCDISHTEINNIERGIRVKPAILTFYPMRNMIKCVNNIKLNLNICNIL